MEKEIDINKLQAELKRVLTEDFYQKGLFIDAMDDVKNWCVGEIIERIDDKLKVHFEGWSNKFDETVSIKSKKIDLFRKHSKGYTGQKITAYRSLHFNSEEFITTRDTIKEIISTNFTCLKTPYEVTQVIRGKIFFNVDIFMTIGYNNNSQYISQTVDMIYDYLDMSICYLNHLKNNIHSSEILEKYPEFYMLNNEFALIACLYEISLTWKRIFGKDERVNAFYKVNIINLRIIQKL
jgi:hypothetical protein